MLNAILDQTERINWYEHRYGATSLLPVPILRKKSDVYVAAVEEAERLGKLLESASSLAFASVMYRLQGHYWQPSMTEKLAISVAEDYARLLGHYPLDILQMACDDWLLDPKNQFFPKVGEIDERMKVLLCERKYRLRKLHKLIERAE